MSTRRSPAARALACLVALLASPTRVGHAACNLIPSATQTFRGALGAANKPFAAPGDFVEVGVQPGGCDVASSGLLSQASVHDVTLVFTPPGRGARRAVVLTADCGAAAAKQAACAAIVGPANVACVDAAAGLALVTRSGIPHLSFRFPDTDALFAPAGDARTLTGPVTIAVTDATQALPCDLATKPCAAETGVLACVDDLYAADGTCAPNPHPTFTHFTALPVPNDYQADCFADAPPCTAFASEARLAVDAAGNLLLPVDWQGVLVSAANVPVPRLLRATVKSPLPFPTPPVVSLGSFTPEGAPLPPIFEPQADPNVTDPNVVTLFGSADASYTILRIARALGNCASGPNAGQACVDSRNCDGAACAPTCVGGTVPPGTACAKDGDCGSGGRCAALFADFRPLVASGGPLVMPRQFAGVCQQEPHQSCTTNAQCTGVANLCVTYAFEARTPVPLESLVQSSPDVFAFSVDEAVAGRDLDGDGDVIDHVVTLQDRTTGQTLPIGAGGAVGRAVTEIHAAPFVFPAVATEDTVAAFLEPEFWQGGQDANGDGDVLDTILRAYRQSGTTAPDATGGRNLAVDAGLLVNERSIAVSGGKVFVRVPEAGNAPVVTERVAVHTTASPLVYQFSRPRLSADGSVVAFPTDADLLPSDTNGLRDVYVRDASGALELVSVTPRGVAANAPSLQPDVSPNGRFVVFETESTDILPGENGIADVFLRDRCVAWGAPVAGCTPTTEKVSLAFDGSLANSSCDAGVVSADGRFVAFRSNSSNLVPVAIPPCSGVLPACTNIFVRDRCVSNGALVTGCSPTTELVSLASDGTVGDNFVGLGGDPASISADGSRIEFVSFATNLVSPPTTSGHVFVHDRRTHTTSVVDVGFDGSEANSQALAGEISADGRYVTFGSSASNVAPPSFGFADVFVRDLATGATERLSHAADGTAPNGHSLFSTISADGRFVAFVSFASNLVPGDTNTCGAFTTPGTCPDVFVADRLTGMLRRASVASDGTQSDGDMLCDGEPANGNTCYGIALSSDGAVVAFDSNATTLLGPGGDTNGVGDTFVRRVGPPPACGNATTDPGEDCDPPGEASCPDGTLCSVTCQCNDVTQDGDVDDTVLEVLDPTTSTVTPLCPAGAVAVTGGMAAFLRPEAAGSAAGCPSGPALGRGVDLDGDGDVDDAVVHLWTGSGAVQNLGLAATAVALSATHVAAIGGSGGTVQTHAVAGGGWADSGEAADALEVCGSIVAFLKPVGDHHVLELWDPATATLTATGEAAEGIVCDDQIVAFRTPEAAAGANLNGPPDADELDDVLQVYDLAGHAVLDTHRAVTPCRLDACDPRVPYRVKGMTVKFLTFEPDQGNTDLNGDGDALDLVLQVYDVATGAVTVVGTPAGTGDPLQGGDPTPSGGGTVYPSSGRCLETLGTPASCATDAACGAGAFCDAGVCEKEQGVCTTTADCPPGIPCVTGAPTVPASPDTDGDGVPDHLDDCPDVPNGDQTDTDHDGVGDACDRATCGNGVVEYDEQCDGAQASACGGGCLPNCRCAVCATGIADPKVKVLVKTRNGVGQLVVKALLPLPAFDAATPVAIRLDDADSTPIVEGRLASVPRQGTRGTKFQYKAKTNGLQKVALKQKVPGTWLLTVKAKRWFTATAANDMAADTRLTVTVGTQCFTHAATLKVD